MYSSDQGAYNEKTPILPSNGVPPPNPYQVGGSNVAGRRYNLLFPQGVGITDRRVEDPDACSCPPLCWCWSRPVEFSDPNFRTYGATTTYCTPKCGTCGWEMANADVLGQRITFEGRGACCGVDSCWEPEVHVFDVSDPNSKKRHIGKAVMKCIHPCMCGEQILTEAVATDGAKKFARFENPWCPMYRRYERLDDSCCGWKKISWPVSLIEHNQMTGKNETNPNNAITNIAVKFKPCMVCHPMWFGVEEMPDVSEDDQKLLLAMAITRWWRMEQQQQENGAAAS